MKKIRVVMVSVLISILLMTLLVGCSSRTQPTKTPTGGTATTDRDTKKVTIEGPEGKVEVTKDRDTEKVTIEGPQGKVEATKIGDDEKVEVEIKKPEGTFKLKTAKGVKESDFTVKFYPGAEIVDGSTTVVNAPEGRDKKAFRANLVTKDDIEKVKKFYKEQFESPIVTEEDGLISILSGSMEMAKGGKMSIVSIQKGEKEGTTEIIILTNDLVK